MYVFSESQYSFLIGFLIRSGGEKKKKFFVKIYSNGSNANEGTIAHESSNLELDSASTNKLKSNNSIY